MKRLKIADGTEEAHEERFNEWTRYIEIINKLQKENEKLKKYKDMYIEQDGRAEELQSKLEELQPFERGADGWGLENDRIVHCKFYIAHENKGYSVVHKFGFGFIIVKDFTTEKPHKNKYEKELEILSNIHTQLNELRFADATKNSMLMDTINKIENLELKLK